MAHSVQVWESDPEAFHYHPIGYLQIAPEVMRADVAQIYEQQQAIGYPSELIEGEDDCRSYMESIFSDWQAKNITAVLHEKKGGYAENMPSMRGLRGQERGSRRHAARAGVGDRVPDRRRARSPRSRPTGARSPASRSWSRPAPGSATSGTCSTCRASVDVKGRDGNVYERPMWTYWCLQEGTLGVDPSYLLDNDGQHAAGRAHRHRRAADRRHGRVGRDARSCGASTTSPTSTSAASRAGRCRGSWSSPPTTWPSIPTAT